jgi:sugar O-acyltransferase (sialic acid O-acetyltransferase NeuD family)
MRDLLIIGAGELAEVALYYFTRDQNRKVSGFAVDPEFCGAESFCGKPLLPLEEALKLFPPQGHSAFVAIGYSDINHARVEKCTQLESHGYDLDSLLHSRAIAWDGFVLSSNCMILELTVIQPFTRVGRAVIARSGVYLGHHAVIGDGCYIGPQAAIGGGAKIGPRSFIGIHATIRDHVKIGERCIVGAGAVVLEDIPPESVISARKSEPLQVQSSEVSNI